MPTFLRGWFSVPILIIKYRGVMMKKLVFIFTVILVFALSNIVSYAQEENPYEEFKEVEFFLP